ncbi:MAG: type II 3-dehydroquinate dehydratase [Alphaproteobacteria bacterium]|nr:type II 3-dehydroquinate dehydratase [Alphaproteobacteria bacterium]
MTKIALINGPNLNMLGIREPHVYGATTLPDLEQRFCAEAEKLGHEVACTQSNYEGALVEYIQQARDVFDGIVINPGAYTHTSIAILDALTIFEGLVIEVHIANVHRRESFRSYSYVSLRADGVIAGCGINSYFLALQQLHLAL